MTPFEIDDSFAPSERELLTDLLVGERRMDDPVVVSARRNPRFARRLEQLLEAQAQLERSGRAVTQALAEPPHAFDLEVQRAARRQLGVEPPRAANASRRSFSIVVALAAALALLVGWLATRPTAERDDVRLSAQSVLEVAADFSSMRWDGECGKLWFQVRVFDEAGNELERSELLKVSEWRPARVSSYPRRITARLMLVNSYEAGSERAASTVERTR